MGYNISSKVKSDGSLEAVIKKGSKSLKVKVAIVHKGQLTSNYSDFLINVKEFEEMQKDENFTNEEKFNAVSNLSSVVRDLLGSVQYKKIKRFFNEIDEVLTEEDLLRILIGVDIKDGETPKG